MNKLAICLSVSVTCIILLAMSACNDGFSDDKSIIVSSDSVGTKEYPGTSCKNIKEENPDAVDAVYWIDPDGDESGNSFQVYCEMDLDGGGWTAVFNLVEPSTAAQMHSALINNEDMLFPVLPNSNSTAVYTDNIPLGDYQEVIYGWAPSVLLDVTRYGKYAIPGGLEGQCYIDYYHSPGVAIASMTVYPSGNSWVYYTGNSVPNVHVGIGYEGQIIVWGYDTNSSSYGNWGNWNDSTSCCNAGNTSDIQNPGWRYVIYIR